MSGPIWHTIRHDDGSWSGFGNVDLATGNSPGPFRHVALGNNPEWGDLELAAIDGNGTVWHTIRRDNGVWTPFENVTMAAGGGIQIWDLALGAAQVDENSAWFLHLVGVGTQQDGGGVQLWHTAFDYNGSWTPWENWNEHLGGGQYRYVGVTGEDQSGDTGTTGTTGTARLSKTAEEAGPSEASQPGVDTPRSAGSGALIGQVTDATGAPLPELQVYLTRGDGSEHQTSTSGTGQYCFSNLRRGEYTLVAGDQHRNVRIGPQCSVAQPEQADLQGVHHITI
jgi:hypothetical protein